MHPIREKTTNRLHQRLCENVVWYSRWHEYEHHRHVHLFVAMVFFVGMVSGVLFQLYFLPVTHAAAGINKQLNYQGKLTDAGGAAVANGTYSMIFSIYTATSGGTATWTETQSVSVASGIFSAMLGSSTSLDAVDFSQDTYYLGVKVGSDAEMTPRKRIGSAAYAVNADMVDGVHGTSFLRSDEATTAAGSLTFNGVTTDLTTTSGEDLTLDPAGTGNTVIITATSSNFQITDGTSTLVSIDNAGAATFNGSLTLGDAAADTLTVNATLQGASPLAFEGLTADDFELTVAVTDPTADRTATIPVLSANDTFAFLAETQTLTNKTIAFSGNTVSGTLAEFNTAVTDADFVSLTGIETLTNKTISLGGDLTLGTNNIVTGAATIASTELDRLDGKDAALVDTNDAVATAITGVGTITTGTWQGSVIGVVYGGTGAATFTTNGLLYGNSTSALQVTAAGTSGQLVVAGATGIPAFVTMSSDATLSSTGALTIAANSVALATDTTGNFVAAVTTSALTGLTGGNTAAENTTSALAFDYSATLAANPALGASVCVFATTGLICEGATANANETLLTFGDPGDDVTITFPAVTGTVITTGDTATVTSAMIGANVVGMADLARGTNGQIIVANTSADSAYVSLSGDATLSAAGALTIAADAVSSAEIAANTVAMADFVRGTDGQIVVANTSADSAYVSVSGDATLSAAGALTVANVTCTDCLNATEIEDIYVLTVGDTMTGDLTISQADPSLIFTDTTPGDGYTISVDASTFTIVNSTDSSRVELNFDGAGGIDLGDNTTSKTIDIGGVTSSASDTINIATNATAADAITIGNANTSTTVALTGGDDWSMAATGVLTMSASADATTAIVITDTNYTNSLSIGDNTITGTTANIDLTAFDVAGATGAVTIDPQTTGTYLDFTLETAWTSGTIINADFASATTQGAGSIVGMLIDLNSNLTTPAAGQSVTGVALQLPVASTTSNTTVYTGVNLSAAGAITNGSGGSFAWRGLNVVMPNITQSSGGSVTSSGALITTGSITTAGTQHGLNIAASGVGAGTLNAINIGGISGSGGAETAIAIGTGWDTGLSFGANAIDGTYFDVAATTGAVTLAQQAVNIVPLTITGVDSSMSPIIDLNVIADGMSVIDIDWTAATQTAAISGIDVDMTNLTADGTNALYGIHVNDQVGSTNSSEYGVYVEGGNWDFGIRVDDAMGVYKSGLGPSTATGFGGVFEVRTTSGTTAATFDITDGSGTLVDFRIGGTSQGSINVADGATVNYAAFTGSHYAWIEKDSMEGIERGMLVVLTEKNKRLHNNALSEIIYGVQRSTQENDPKILGAYLGVQNPGKPGSVDNPHLVMAVGNGDVWVVDNGQNIAAGDYLISSSVPGHATRNNGTSVTQYIIARAAEAVDWGTVTETVDDNGVFRKHIRLSIFFESFEKQVVQGGSVSGALVNSDLLAVKELTVTGPAYVQGSLTVAGDVTFKGRLIVEGTAEFRGHIIFDKDTAGNIVIPKGEGHADVYFTQPFEAIPSVTVTPTDDPGTWWWVSHVSQNGFRVNLGKISTKDLGLNWIAIVAR